MIILLIIKRRKIFLLLLGRPTNLDYCRARAYCACSRSIIIIKITIIIMTIIIRSIIIIKITIMIMIN